MFTGIVEEIGRIETATWPAAPQPPAAEGGHIRIASSKVLDAMHVGDSVAVDGCCITVTATSPAANGPGWWEADLSDETLRRTTLGERRPGDLVNLERPVRLADRLGGHIVQGHVDGVGEVVDPAPNLVVRMPRELLRYVVEKGSVTVDGVSLTVVDVGDDGFSVALIPHTMEVTTLGRRRPGDRVNLEVDVTVKYVERLLAWRDETK